jgi:SAM-dependent methyltransferase
MRREVAVNAILQWLMRRAERHPDPILRAHHQELLAGVRGRVVEVGCGRGRLFACYPDEVTSLIAVEPDPLSREQARRVAASHRLEIAVHDGRAEALPVESGSADVVVCCEVLCSVADLATALREARRVLRPGGELRVYEHELARSVAGKLAQCAVDRAGWPRLLDGCHAARDITGAIDDAGFRWSRRRRTWQASMPLTWPTGPHVLGIAHPT